jgi:hypothetical protein
MSQSTSSVPLTEWQRQLQACCKRFQDVGLPFSNVYHACIPFTILLPEMAAPDADLWGTLADVPSDKGPLVGGSYWQVGEGTVFGRYWGSKEGLLAFRPIASSAFLALAEAPAGSLPRRLIDTILPPPTRKDYSSNWLALVYLVQEECPSPQLRVLEKYVQQLGYSWVTAEWGEGIETTSLSYKWLGQDIFASSIAAIALLCPSDSAETPVQPTIRQQTILEALGSEKLTGMKLAERAGYSYNSAFKSELSVMVKLGMLIQERPGYRRNSQFQQSPPGQ